jgi:CheY-like chemotaxis protein
MDRVKKKILVIDDDEKHLLTVKAILDNEGYDVFIHHMWFGATNLIRKMQPDLVLLDINMPCLSGEKLSSLILTNGSTKHIPVVFHSSNDEDSLRKAVLECGVHGYICKGSVFDLRKKIAFYLSWNERQEVR